MGVTDRRARPAAIAVLGSTTCEDAAAVTSPLRALGGPFADVDSTSTPRRPGG